MFDPRQFIALVWNALRFYQAFSAEEGAWVREQMSKLELLRTAAGKSRRAAIEGELRARGRVRGEMAQQVQFCMTEVREIILLYVPLAFRANPAHNLTRSPLLYYL